MPSIVAMSENMRSFEKLARFTESSERNLIGFWVEVQLQFMKRAARTKGTKHSEIQFSQRVVCCIEDRLQTGQVLFYVRT